LYKGEEMIPYRKEKLENAICYFIKKHEEIAQKPAYKTFIFKYLALFDFAVLAKTGSPALEIQYLALQNGPVPEKLFNHQEELRSTAYSVTEDDEDRVIYNAVHEPNLDYFSEIELEVLEATVSEYMYRGMTTQPLCDKTHEKIRAWRAAWNRRYGNMEKISYDDTFPCLYEKAEEELTAQEDAFLLYKTSIQY